MNKFGFV